MERNKDLGAMEEQMFSEIFAVMKKYEGATREFGLNLIHEHFALNTNEVLYETHNKEDRTLHVHTVLFENLPALSKATAWALGKSGRIEVMQFCCDE